MGNYGYWTDFNECLCGIMDKNENPQKIRKMKFTLNNDEKPENANAHIWNYVKVNGSWYHIDATWNDNASDDTSYMHEYFMLTDEELKKKDSSTAHNYIRSS